MSVETPGLMTLNNDAGEGLSRGQYGDIRIHHQPFHQAG